MDRAFSWFGAAVVALLTGGAAHAQSVEGVLERGRDHSALFGVSPESGDPIGHLFRNQSAVGRAILANCLPDMLCVVGKGRQRLLEREVPAGFSAGASGWYEITAAQDVHMAAAVHGYEKAVKTRLGPVRIVDDKIILPGNKAIPVEGDFASVVAAYESGPDALLLVQEAAGRACPAMYRVLTLSTGRATATPPFGTCSDIIYPQYESGRITVSMTGFVGEGEPQADQRKAAMTKHVFVISNGKVVEQTRSR